MDNERTFTQAEVDQIISERLRKERAKFTAEAQQREAELNRRESLLTIKEDWSKRGLPVSLLDSLDITKDGALEAAENIIATMQAKGSTPAYKGGNPDSGRMGASEADSLRNAFGLKNH